MEEKYNAAKQLEREQQHEAAAAQFAAVIAEEPLSIISQESALRSARCLQKAGKHVEAIQFYDQVISIADARFNEEGGKGVILKRRKRDALFDRAGALNQAGNAEAATLAYQQAIDVVFADLAAEVPSANMRQDSAVNLQQSGLQMASWYRNWGGGASSQGRKGT